MERPKIQNPLAHVELDLHDMACQATETVWRVHALLEVLADGLSVENQWKFVLEAAALMLKPAAEQISEIMFQLPDPSQAEEGQQEEVGS